MPVDQPPWATPPTFTRIVPAFVRSNVPTERRLVATAPVEEKLTLAWPRKPSVPTVSVPTPAVPGVMTFAASFATFRAVIVPVPLTVPSVRVTVGVRATLPRWARAAVAPLIVTEAELFTEPLPVKARVPAFTVVAPE